MPSVDVSVSTVIACPRHRVASFASEIDNVRKWYVNIKSVEWETEPPTSLGSRATFVAYFLGKRLAYTYEVVELVPDEKLVMRTTEGPFPMETSYRWEIVNESSTRMTLRNRGKPSGFSSLISPLMSLMLRRTTSKDLALLKRTLENSDEATSEVD
ncbi:MAG: SRPBCC family protein [Pirellulales bacterium]|nr:SRPBCC family protein [Pirellulales bacterium]